MYTLADIEKNINKINKNEYFINSVINEQYDIIEFLLENGANVNYLKDIALLIAVKMKNIKMIHFLIGKGANVNERKSISLNYASTHGFYTITEILLNYGAYPTDDIIEWCEITSYDDCLNLLLSFKKKNDTLNKMDIKILFLDVDGVLNTINSKGRLICKNGDLFELNLNNNRIKLLKKIIENTNCKIVLTSTWRMKYIACNKLEKKLKYKNIEIYDRTPILGEKSMRGDEIKLWINQYKQKYDIFDMKYAIVDDDEIFLEEQLDFFVKTDPLKGLTNENVENIIKILN